MYVSFEIRWRLGDGAKYIYLICEFGRGALSKKKINTFLTDVFRKETAVSTITFSLKVRLHNRYALLWTRQERRTFIIIILSRYEFIPCNIF